MKYLDEDDKCYGVTGMAIGLAIFDADDLFNHISLEGEGLDCVEFSPRYYFTGNTILSARSSWQRILEHYQLTIGLVLADVMCRKMCHEHKELDHTIRKQVLKAACEEGKRTCQLEADEVEQIFNKSYSYLSRLLSNYQVQELVNNFVSTLKERRKLSCYEVMDMLSLLRS